MLGKNKKRCACLLALVLVVCQLIGTVDVVQAEGNAFKDILIVVDAGHTSNYNVGSVAGYNEGDWAYKQMLYDAEAYRAAGFTVMTTRGQHDNPGLVARGQMAVQNAAGYRDVVFISNHTNATGDRSPHATGVNACSSQYLSQKNTNLINAMMTAVAETMNKGTGVTYVRKNEIFAKPLNSAGADWYGVIRGAVNGATSVEQAAQGPVQYAFILEHGFHTNPVECAFLMDDNNCRALAVAKANAMAQYFGNLYGVSYTLQDVNTGASQVTPVVPETQAPVVTEKPSTTTEIVLYPEDSYNFWSGVVNDADDGLNVRTEANAYADNVVAKLDNGTSVVVIGEAISVHGETWFSIVSGGIKGFVNAKYIMPKYYDSKSVTVAKNAPVYLLPNTTMSSSTSYSAGDSVVALNELKQDDGWWYIVKINGNKIGFIPNKYVSK